MSCATRMAGVPSVPVHGNQEVRIGTLRGILRDCRLTVDEFLSLLD
jgi:predicted RNA binding protein YcfA (HicA-like mRNA interferase family)